MLTDKIVFCAVMLVGLPALAYSIGIERGEYQASKNCPLVQGERLQYSEQRPGMLTVCNYSIEPSYGMAKRKRKV